MYVSTCICVYTHIYICTHVFTYKKLYIHMYVCIYIYFYICVCTGPLSFLSKTRSRKPSLRDKDPSRVTGSSKFMPQAILAHALRSALAATQIVQPDAKDHRLNPQSYSV